MKAILRGAGPVGTEKWGRLDHKGGSLVVEFP
jgi:hypothetical protein